MAMKIAVIGATGTAGSRTQGEATAGRTRWSWRDRRARGPLACLERKLNRPASKRQVNSLGACHLPQKDERVFPFDADRQAGRRT